jgi:osmotically-inducible protein OsmY
LLDARLVHAMEMTMAERYWSDSDAQWPEGHEFDQSSGRFDGMEQGAAAATRHVPQHPAGEAHGRTAPAYQRSDARIRDDVCERLAHSNAVDVSDVGVTVNGGIVTLEGTVPERPMRYALEDISARCLGVLDVDNRVRVAPRHR